MNAISALHSYRFAGFGLARNVMSIYMPAMITGMILTSFILSMVPQLILQGFSPFLVIGLYLVLAMVLSMVVAHFIMAPLYGLYYLRKVKADFGPMTRAAVIAWFEEEAPRGDLDIFSVAKACGESFKTEDLNKRNMARGDWQTITLLPDDKEAVVFSGKPVGTFQIFENDTSALQLNVALYECERGCIAFIHAKNLKHMQSGVCHSASRFSDSPLETRELLDAESPILLSNAISKLYPSSELGRIVVEAFKCGR